jgi:hypothetical protein
MDNLELINKIQDAIFEEADKKSKMADGKDLDIPYIDRAQRHDLIHQALGLNEALSIIENFKIIVMTENKKGE